MLGSGPYVSPDLLLAANDLSAMRDGSFLLVVGELHAAINSQQGYCFVNQHPDPDELRRCVAEDFPEPRLLPTLPKWAPPRLSIRTHPALTLEQDYLVELSHRTAPADRPRLCPARDIVVLEEQDGLWLCLPDGELFPLLDFYGAAFMESVVDELRIVPTNRRHTPRITVDKVVLVRETWRVPADELAFPELAGEHQRFVAARRWQLANHVPRYTFVTASGEKPVFVDFTSPVYVNLLVKMARRAGADSTLTLTEMLPAPEQTWLTDAQGRRYTAELRMTAVDSRG